MFDSKSFLTGFINFEKVADHVLSTDGWEITNGEYSHFGEYNGEEIYLNFSSCGQHKEEIKDLKECWVSKEDLKQIYEFWDKQHLKPLKMKTIEIMNKFFDEGEKKGLCNDEDVLNKYLGCIEW